MSPLDWSWLVAGLLLQSVVISTMLRGSWRKYRLIFAYLIFTLLSTVAQFSFKFYFGAGSHQFFRAYWIGDFVGTCLVLLIIIGLIRTAMCGHPNQKSVYLGLLLGVVATAVGSLLLMHFLSRRFTFGRWMTEVGRDYYFSAVLLNAILWFTLLRRKNANPQLYLLTSGLGLKLCGAAISHALRLVAPVWLGNQFIVLTYMLSLYVWYVALGKAPDKAPLGELSATRS
jgi:hypothetical protein